MVRNLSFFLTISGKNFNFEFINETRSRWVGFPKHYRCIGVHYIVAYYISIYL